MRAKKCSITHTLLEMFLRSRGGSVAVLQIGANDGVIADHIYRRALRGDWFGVFVEPHPAYFEKLRENYKSLERGFFENVAVSNEDCAEKSLFYVSCVPVEKDWVQGIASFDRGHLIKHGIAEEHIADVRVSITRLQALVEKYYLYDLDLLVIDVEGHELEVFMSADFNTFRPKAIMFEHAHLSPGHLDLILEHVGPAYDYCAGELDSFLFRNR